MSERHLLDKLRMRLIIILRRFVVSPSWLSVYQIRIYYTISVNTCQISLNFLDFFFILTIADHNIFCIIQNLRYIYQVQTYVIRSIYFLSQL